MRMVTKRHKRFGRAGRWVVNGSIVGLMAVPAVQAQTTAPTPTDAASPAQAPQAQAAQAPASQAQAQTQSLGTVTVTAERRTENLQKTPVAVTVLQGSDLQTQGRYTLTQILEDVPSVTIQPPVTGQSTLDSPANVISIRGIGANTPVNGNYGASVVPAVGYYVDGVLNGMGGGYDLQQVQVLRGPQGTLYGRSATAGAFIAKTYDPELKKFTGDAAVEVGDYNLRHITGGVNIPVNDTLALRVSANSFTRDGFYAPTGNQTDIKDARIKALYKPNNDFSLLLGAATEHTREFSGQLLGRLSGTGTDTVTYNVNAPIGSGWSDQQQFWGQLNWNLGAATLTYIPAFRTFRQDTTFYAVPAPGALVSNNVKIPTNWFHTEELRLASNATSPLKWQTGVFYYNNHLDLENLGRVSLSGPPPGSPPPPPGAPPAPTGLTLYSAQPLHRLTENVGVFGEATYALAPDTRVTAGLRYDYTKVATTDHSCTGPDGLPLTCLDLTGNAGSRIWHNMTYKLRLERDVTPTNMVYASVSSAFIPGDMAVTTGLSGFPIAAPYEAETLTSFELGTKNRFLSDTLQVNAALFAYKFGGHQLPVVIGQLNPGNILLYQTMNSPARMLGAELEVSYRPTAHDRFDLAMSYVRARYVNKPAPFAAGVANDELANVVPWNIAPAYSHTFEVPNGNLVFRAEALYRSSYLVNDITAANSALGLESYVRNGSTLQGNVSLTYNLFSPDVSITAYVRNVTNVKYKTFVGLVSPVAAANGAQLSDPRTFGVVLAGHF